MSSPSSWTHAAECWSSAEDAVRIANAPVIVSMDTEFWWLFYAMWMTVAYLMLSFGEPLFSFLFGLRLPRLLTWLRSGVRSLDVVERFEMETRLQVLREKLLTEHERTLDGYIIDVENRTDILENKLKAEKQLSKQLQNEINDIKLAHSHHTHQDRPRMDDNVRNLQTTLDRVNAMYRALQLVLEQYGVSEAEIASYQPAYRLPEEQSQRNADALSKRLTDVTKLYSDLRHASAEIFKENETLKAQVPKWKPYTGSVYIYEISIDETIGKLDPLTRVPKVGDNSQNDYPQTSPELPPSPSEEPASSPEEPPSSPPSSPASALEEPPSPPEEPSLLLAEPFSPPARPFSSPEDPTFASPQVAGITLLGNPLIVTSTVERDLWQWLNKYCYDVYGPILDGYQRWLRLVSTFDASIIESSLPGPNMQSETTLEHARHLQRILHNELKQYCSLYYMAEPVFDNAGSLVPSGDNTVQPARGADEPEHVPSMPDAWNAPLHNHGTFSRQVEEIIRGTGSGNEPTPIPTVPEHIPNYVDAAHLTYPQLDESSSRHSEALIDLESPDIISNHADARHLTYPRLDESSSRHNEGSSDLESPEIIPNPAGTSYGLDYSNFGVKSKSLTPPVVVQGKKPSC
ncbi:hypothetical protein MMC17_003380 [Xylographa soralifera]|nr:hypothetical protein [Xylographa soralifera]